LGCGDGPTAGWAVAVAQGADEKCEKSREQGRCGINRLRCAVSFFEEIMRSPFTAGLGSRA
jgi:hypothetical protein